MKILNPSKLLLIAIIAVAHSKATPFTVSFTSCNKTFHGKDLRAIRQEMFAIQKPINNTFTSKADEKHAQEANRYANELKKIATNQNQTPIMQKSYYERHLELSQKADQWKNFHAIQASIENNKDNFCLHFKHLPVFAQLALLEKLTTLENSATIEKIHMLQESAKELEQKVNQSKGFLKKPVVTRPLLLIPILSAIESEAENEDEEIIGLTRSKSISLFETEEEEKNSIWI